MFLKVYVLVMANVKLPLLVEGIPMLTCSQYVFYSSHKLRLLNLYIINHCYQLKINALRVLIKILYIEYYDLGYLIELLYCIIRCCHNDSYGYRCGYGQERQRNLFIETSPY